MEGGEGDGCGIAGVGDDTGRSVLHVEGEREGEEEDDYIRDIADVNRAEWDECERDECIVINNFVH